MSPGMLLQQQHLQTEMHSANLGSTTPACPATVGQGIRWGHSDQQQPKNSVFSNALSSPVRRSLQSYHTSSNFMSYGNGPRCSNNEINNSHHQQNRDTNSPMSNDSLDMRADSPDRDFPG